MSEAVRIRAIVAGGDGVGTLADGRAVFVPRTAPGDLVELSEPRLARRFARARIGRLLEASPARVTPRCPHYEADDCGGCQLQHLDAESQRGARRQLVGDALRRIGKLELETPPLEPSATEWDYRAKISLAARGRRIGYHRLGQPEQVFELVRCPIARPELNALWTALQSCRELLPRKLERIVLRVDRAGACHLMVRTTTEDVWTRGKALGAALATWGVEAVIWWQPAGGAPRTVSGAREAYPVTVFEQVHPVMGDRAREWAIDQIATGATHPRDDSVIATGAARPRDDSVIATGAAHPRDDSATATGAARPRDDASLQGLHIWDLYAGIGETTRALLALGATVESVERDPRAVRLAEELGPAEGVARRVGRVEDWLRRLKPADAAIVNPPRTGLGKEVTDRLTSRPPGRLVYLSCDPATLARDLARLVPVYRVAGVQAFDLFPQTAHVETVVWLERR